MIVSATELNVRAAWQSLSHKDGQKLNKYDLDLFIGFINQVLVSYLSTADGWKNKYTLVYMGPVCKQCLALRN